MLPLVDMAIPIHLRPDTVTGKDLRVHVSPHVELETELLDTEDTLDEELLDDDFEEELLDLLEDELML